MREELNKKMRAKGFITVKEAATEAGIPKSTMYDWLGRGYVIGRKLGGARFVSQRSLSDHLKPLTGKQ